MKAHPVELRERVVRFVERGGKKTEAALRFEIGERSSYTYDHLGRRGTKSCFGTTYTALFFTWLGRIPTQQIKIQLPRLGYGCSEKLQEILQRP